MFYSATPIPDQLIEEIRLNKTSSNILGVLDGCVYKGLLDSGTFAEAGYSWSEVVDGLLRQAEVHDIFANGFRHLHH